MKGGLSPGPFQISLPQVLGKALDGATEHGTGHARVVSIKKVDEQIEISLAHLPQHPPHRLVQQVMRVVTQYFGKPDGICIRAGPDGMKGR